MNFSKDISKKTFWLIITLLIVLRIIMVVLAMHDIPHTGVEEGGWWFYHGGDEGPYFDLAKSITQNSLAKEKYPLGFPLFLAPFIWLTGAENIKDILEPVFVVQAFLLFSLSIILVGGLANFIFKNRRVAVVSAGLFTIYPYIFYLLFHRLGPYYEEIGLTRGMLNFVALNWLQIISDGLSAFLVFLCFFLFFNYLKKQRDNLSLVIFLAILAGFSTLVRLSNVLLLPIIGIALLAVSLRQRIKRIFLFGFFFAFTLLPQFIYNFLFFGNPLKFGYEGCRGKEGIFSFFSWSRMVVVFEKANSFFPGFVFFGLGALVLLFFAFRYLARSDKITALVLFLWLFGYCFFYILYNDAGFQARFFIPVVPPLIFVVVSFFLWIFQKLKQYEPR